MISRWTRFLSILNAVSGIDNVAPRDAIDVYFGLLDYYEWEPATQPMMEALARLMGKKPGAACPHIDIFGNYSKAATVCSWKTPPAPLLGILSSNLKMKKIFRWLSAALRVLANKAVGAGHCKTRCMPGGGITPIAVR